MVISGHKFLSSLTPTGKPRPAYRVLQRVLAQRAAAKLGGT